MSLEEATPTIDDLRQFPWREVETTAREQTCFHFANAVLDIDTKMDDGARKAQALLAFSLGLVLRIHNEATPYETNDHRHAIPSTVLTATHVAALAGWLLDASPKIALIEARIADLVWLSRKEARDHEIGVRAVHAYLASVGTALSRPNSRRVVVECLHRALLIARRLGKHRQAEVASVIAVIEEVVKKGEVQSAGLRDVQLMRLLQQYGNVDGAFYATLCSDAAQSLEKAADEEPFGGLSLRLAREYWQTAADWLRKLDKQGQALPTAQEARLRAAETYVKEADKARDAGRIHEEASALGDAITAYRKQNISGQRVDDLIKRMRQSQSAAPRVQFSSGINVTDIVMRAQSDVSSLGLYNALFRLAYISEVPTRAQLREAVDRYLENSITAKLAGAVLSHTDDRVVSRFPAFSPPSDADSDDDKKNRERYIEWQMWSHASFFRSVETALIYGACMQILVEHNPTIEDLLPIVDSAPIVPPGHELLFAKGLHAGLHGDWTTAIHILVPQLEAGLRWLIESLSGKAMVSHKDDGTQTVNLFAKALDNQTVCELLGPDLVFIMQGLFLKQEATNLRNEIAHGLVDDRAMMSATPMYAWWLVLHLCIRLREQLAAATSTNDVNDGRTSE